MTATAQETLPAAIYARISKTDKKFDKVDNQTKQCRELAEPHGYAVLDHLVFADDGISAFRENDDDRPGMNALIAAARRGEFKVLLTTNQDRIGRGSDLAMILAAVCAEQGIRWHMVHGGLRDFDEPASELITYVMNWQAKQDSATKVGKIRDRKDADRRAGHPGHGPRPFGYSQDRMAIVEPEASLIREGCRKLLGGEDRTAVVRFFNDPPVPWAKVPTTRGGKVWRASTVYDVLGRWRNCAVVEHEGEPVGEGTWPAIVSRADVENVRILLATPPRGHERMGRPAETLLSGVAWCHCGAVMHAHGMNWARVYRCSTLSDQATRRPAPPNEDGSPGKHAAIKIELLDELARAEVIEAYFHPFPSEAPADEEVAVVVDLHTKLAKVRGQRAKLRKMRLEDDITEAEFKADNGKLRTEESELIEQIEHAARASAHAAMIAADREILALDRDNWTASGARKLLGEKFDALPLPDRRRLVSSLVELTVYPSKGRGKGTDRVDVGRSW